MLEREEITSQIDLIVYDNSIPTLFSEGDFVIVLSESVYGIIEVKSKIEASDKFVKAIKKAKINGEKIAKHIFNGIFGFDNAIRFSEDHPLAPSIREALIDNSGYLNHISFGPNVFMKYWAEGNPQDNAGICLSFYKLHNLSFGYFISNLIEMIHVKSRGLVISEDLQNFLYPIEDGKESKRLRNLELKL